MSGSFARIRTVFAKEVTDNIRDRRSVLGAFFYPLLGPALMMVLLFVVGRTFSEQSEEVLELPVVGAEHAPGLIDFMKAQGAVIVDAPDDPEAAVKAGDLDVVLEIPEGYGEDFSVARPAPVRLIVDDSRNTAAVPIRRTERLLDAYSRQIGALRLLARGVSPGLVDALAVEEVNVATAQSQAASLLNLMPYFLIFSTFIGGMYLAIDATAGERERGSLEPLLINPVARWELVFGKLTATILFTWVSVIETLVAFIVLLRFVPFDETLGVRIDLAIGSFLVIFLITLPMTLLAVPLQFIIAAYTRSFKEAQNYLSLLPLVPALPGMFLAFIPFKPTLWSHADPHVWSAAPDQPGHARRGDPAAACGHFRRNDRRGGVGARGGGRESCMRASGFYSGGEVGLKKHFCSLHRGECRRLVMCWHDRRRHLGTDSPRLSTNIGRCCQKAGAPLTLYVLKTRSGSDVVPTAGGRRHDGRPNCPRRRSCGESPWAGWRCRRRGTRVAEARCRRCGGRCLDVSVRREPAPFSLLIDGARAGRRGSSVRSLRSSVAPSRQD